MLDRIAGETNAHPEPISWPCHLGRRSRTGAGAGGPGNMPGAEL